MGHSDAILVEMTRLFGPPPISSDIEALALAALARFPEAFRVHLGDIIVTVEEFADDDTLAQLGVADPFELTGLYEGIPLGEKHDAPCGALPDHIRLFRQPILDEWIDRETETLEHLVTHILIHEVGHHFGQTDDDIDRLERE